ncbi:MAG: L,D-transpeptidase family protein [Eubacterium sp.]|nr:L,D-transpeptidase family protein [Eubacterium sp.]
MIEKSRIIRNFFAVLALAILLAISISTLNINAAGRHGSGEWKTNSQGKWYEYEDGYYPKSKWVKIDGYWYYFGKTGYLRTGWIKINNKWYYSNKKGHRLHGWRNINGKTYYLDKKKNGVMITGWKKTAKGWYYLREDGSLVRGEWISDNGNRYYLKKNGLLPKKGWIKIRNEFYYITKNGSVMTGWFKEKSKYYYFYDDGRMARSTWICWKGKWYYLLSNGKMATGTRKVDGKTYDFGTDGAIEDPMLSKAQQYSSSTKYLILVNRTDHKVAIYEGSVNNWAQIKSFTCSDGESTPNGIFTIGVHIEHFGEDHGYTCWYASQISGNYLFHSVLYYPYSKENIMDGTLGARVSQGCIRLEINNAKWIYDNIPSGTKVVMYQ